MARLSPAVDWDYYPPGAQGATELEDTPLAGVVCEHAPLGAGAMSFLLPLNVLAPAHTGIRQLSYSDDLLYRIHVTPGSFALGNVAGTVTRTFSVWNAQFVDVTLDGILGTNDDGITITGQAGPPLRYLTLQDLDYTLTVTPDGPAGINASFLFGFSDGSLRTLTVTGNRAVAWTWAPDWGQPLVERLEWRTEVHRSFNGREQRRALRQGARRMIESTTLMSQADRQRLELALFGWGARSWALPLWWDGQALTAPVAPGATSIACQTAGREFAVGRYAMLTSGYDASEIVEVQSFTGSVVTLARPVGGTWPAGSMFYPATIAQLDPSITIERFSDSASILGTRFTSLEPADVAAGTLPLYLGYPVLDARPLLPGSMSATFERKLEDIDNGTGLPFRDDEAGIPLLSQTFGWQVDTRAQGAALRALFYLLAGRLGAVWLPTMASDLTLLVDVPDSAANIDVGNRRYGLFAQAAVGRNHLRIERRNGTVSYHKVTGSAEISAAVERLTITPAITPALAAADAMQISFMHLHRQASDAVEIAHFTGEATSVQTTMIGFRHDL